MTLKRLDWQIVYPAHALPDVGRLSLPRESDRRDVARRAGIQRRFSHKNRFLQIARVFREGITGDFYRIFFLF